MKINNMTAKTSLEINDSDILIIQDEEATKQVTVNDFKDYLLNSSNKDTKKIINETIDKICKALKSTKHILSEDYPMLVGAWIGSTSGNIQFVLKDVMQDKWLTQEELESLDVINNFKLKILINDIYHNPEGEYQVLRFNDLHPQGTNPVLEDADAGFIKIHFEGLSQNEIAAIKYDSIEIENIETEELKYIFTVDEESFSNGISYVEDI